MNIRIQTYGKMFMPMRCLTQLLNSDVEGTAIQALEKGLRDLQDLCDVVAEKFNEAREEFNSNEG